MVVLPEPVCPTSAIAFAQIHRERNVLQHPIFVFICEPDVLKFDLAALCPVFSAFRATLISTRRSSSMKDPVRRDDRRLQHVEFVRQIADRLKKLQRILDERRQNADRQSRAAPPKFRR